MSYNLELARAVGVGFLTTGTFGGAGEFPVGNPAQAYFQPKELSEAWSASNITLYQIADSNTTDRDVSGGFSKQEMEHATREALKVRNLDSQMVAKLFDA